MTTQRRTASLRHSPLLYLLATVPALVLGVLVMRSSDVPAALWGQNVAAWVLGTLLCLGLWRTRASPERQKWAVLVAVFTLAVLAATLLAPGVQGVHRWVKLGPVRLHAGALLLPLLLVALEKLARVRGWWVATLVALAATLALFLQPDAAQATAFAAASAVLLLPGAGRAPLRLIGILPLPVLAGLSWLRRDPLAPVAYVEEIVGLAAGLGTGWAVAALISLALLPIPFLLPLLRDGSRARLALGTYLTITAIAPFVGSFPVPVMGYGVSPIIGYLAGLGLFLGTSARQQEQGSTD